MNKPQLIVSLLNFANRQVTKSLHIRTTIVQSYSLCKPLVKQHVSWPGKCSAFLKYSTSHKSFPNETTDIEETTTTTSVNDSGKVHNDIAIDVSPQDCESPDIKFITNGDPTLEKKLKILFLELEVFRQEGKRVPSSLNNEQWREILNTTTRSARKKYLAYLWGVEMKKEGDKRKKEEKRHEKEERYASNIIEDEGQIHYGLNRNTIHMRIYDTTINQHFNNKLVQAIQFGQKIIVDCGYDAHMTSREAINAAKQITILFSENRNHPDPFNLYLCNGNRQGHTMTQLQRFINTLYEDHFPVNVTKNSYLDLFPKESLVYLTPHCRDELSTFDHDAIYIIGAMVDKVNTEPLSLAKAKKEGLRMAKLPLERYLNWGSGSGKSLTLNQMMLIMLEMKTSGDWEKALVHVPRRKLNFDQEPGSQYQSKYRPQSKFQLNDEYQPRSLYSARNETEHPPGGGRRRDETDRDQYQPRQREEHRSQSQYQARNHQPRRRFQDGNEDEAFVKKYK